MGKKSKNPKKSSKGKEKKPAKAVVPPPPPVKHHWEIPLPALDADDDAQATYLEKVNDVLKRDYDPPLANPDSKLWVSSEAYAALGGDDDRDDEARERWAEANEQIGDKFLARGELDDAIDAWKDALRCLRALHPPLDARRLPWRAASALHAKIARATLKGLKERFWECDGPEDFQYFGEESGWHARVAGLLDPAFREPFELQAACKRLVLDEATAAGWEQTIDCLEAMRRDIEAKAQPLHAPPAAALAGAGDAAAARAAAAEWLFPLRLCCFQLKQVDEETLGFWQANDAAKTWAELDDAHQGLERPASAWTLQERALLAQLRAPSAAARAAALEAAAAKGVAPPPRLVEVSASLVDLENGGGGKPGGGQWLTLSVKVLTIAPEGMSAAARRGGDAEDLRPVPDGCRRFQICQKTVVKVAKNGSERLVGPDDGRAAEGSPNAVEAARRRIEDFVAECASRGYTVDNLMMGQGLLGLVGVKGVAGSGYGSRDPDRFGGTLVIPATPWLQKQSKAHMAAMVDDVEGAMSRAMLEAMTGGRAPAEPDEEDIALAHANAQRGSSS